MKVKHYLGEWRGIVFRDLPIDLAGYAVADSTFYNAFYSALAKKAGDAEQNWRTTKIEMGTWVEKTVLRRHVAPRVISIGAGQALAESVWLRKGYDVTLNECQELTLKPVKEEFSGAKIIVGEAFELTFSEKFDVATMFALDYALSDDALLRTFRNIAPALTERGELVNNTVDTLTVLQLAKEFVKRVVRKKYDKTSYVIWGWRRTPGLIMRLAKKAGLELHEQWIVKHNAFSLRPRALWRFPTLCHANMVMIFRRCSRN